MMAWSRASLALGLMIVVACSTPTDSCGCIEPLPAATVTGTTADSSGLTLSDVIVTAEVSDSTCAQPGVLVAQVASDSTGRFSLQVGFPSQPTIVCVDVIGLRIHDVGFDSVAVRGLRTPVAFVDHPILVVDLVFPIRADSL